MSKMDLLFEALREANPSRDESSPIPELDEILGEGRPVLARPAVEPARGWRPWIVAPAAFLAILVPGLILLLDRQPPPEAPPATTVETTLSQLNWCNVDDLAYEIDPQDPASVESGYRGILAIDLVRASLAPESIAEEASLVADHTRNLVDELEANGWDPAAVDTALPPEVAEARATIEAFTRDLCGG
jgi:hypothetical protein